jgi:ribulose-phosphate 3-epimerase
MGKRDHLAALRRSAPGILPSLLLCDFANLAAEVARLEEAGVPALHLDVMDGVFVPNLTYGMPIVEALRRVTDLPLDVHLMIADPARYLSAFRDAGADLVTFHVEAVECPQEVLEKARELGLSTGLALNPGTSLDEVSGCWDLCDLVLVMSVEAGFGGQAFQPVALEKLRRARELGGADLLLEVDGGVNLETIAECAEAGADLFVVGSGIFRFRPSEYVEAVEGLRKRAESGVRGH